MEEAYRKGRDAYLNGDHVNDNPYPGNTDEYFEWDIGFNSAGFHSKRTQH